MNKRLLLILMVLVASIGTSVIVYAQNNDVDGDGYVTDDPPIDCDDNNPGINPGAADDTVDGIDQNCDGSDGPPGLDSDGDGILDVNDGCITQAGLPQFDGCPDTDGDGIPDMGDQCPNEFGPATTGGCPDADGDGMLDGDDLCPNQAGPFDTGGCPDADNDLIIDSQDACPNEFGPLATNGCPDRDGDGFIDSQDSCPDAAGVAQFNGCPDTDSDGIPDSEDSCPEIAGTAEFNGCQFFDSDLDEINDDDDLCINEAGPALYNGCPAEADNDGDGVPNSEDQCVNVAGDWYAGCPADADGDGLEGSADECPFVAGAADAEYPGCPAEDVDSDGDGFTDQEEWCDLEPGVNFGCAPVIETYDPGQDYDGDGVFGDDDLCPYTFGERSDGCPDADGDGVYDFNDYCPDETEDVDEFGCSPATENEIISEYVINFEEFDCHYIYTITGDLRVTDPKYWPRLRPNTFPPRLVRHSYTATVQLYSFGSAIYSKDIPVTVQPGGLTLIYEQVMMSETPWFHGFVGQVVAWAPDYVEINNLQVVRNDYCGESGALFAYANFTGSWDDFTVGTQTFDDPPTAEGWSVMFSTNVQSTEEDTPDDGPFCSGGETMLDNDCKRYN